jgi:hypothetical protein
VGRDAGEFNQQGNCVAIGSGAGETFQGSAGVAVGSAAGQSSQGTIAVAVGNAAGRINQGARAVAIGSDAGWTGQGFSSIAIGFRAGWGQVANAQPANTIILNATGSYLEGISGQTGSCYIKPIRSITGNSTGNSNFPVTYNPFTGELTIP